MILDTAAQWAANNGLAVAILLAIGIGGWKGSVAVFTYILLPIKDAAISHFSHMSTFMETTTKALQHTTVAMESVAKTIDKIQSDLECKNESDKRGNQ